MKHSFATPSDLASRASRFIIAAISVSLIAGCGNGRPTTVPISGKVRIDGVPLANAQIGFYPDGGRPAFGRTDDFGNYRLSCFQADDGALQGTHRVTVRAVQPLSPTELKWLAPKRYADPNESALKVTVNRPSSDVNLELTWDGKQPFVDRLVSSQGD